MGLEIVLHCSLPGLSYVFFILSCSHPKFSALVTACPCPCPSSPTPHCPRPLHSPVPSSFLFCLWPFSPLGIFATS